jgi:molybdenum cofactor biosynthesis protein B
MTTEEASKPIVDAIVGAQFSFVRSVTVNGEVTFIQQAVSTVSNTNEADAIVMVGGAGFGPRDYTCEAVDGIVERRIEGFGEAYRRLVREEFEAGASAMLVRATAGVYNRCLVFALPRHAARLRRGTTRFQRRAAVPASSKRLRAPQSRRRCLPSSPYR